MSIQKSQLSFRQMFNLNFGFLGIQFGWLLQMANMSGIYKFLGADVSQMGYLWLAAPLSGMIIQPLIGQLSDRTWFKLSRRKPYILGGAVLSSIALILIPNSSSLLMAASLLWLLDGSINIAMQPYRALVADVSPENQMTTCFAMQSCLIGIGATVAAAFPWILENIFHLQSNSANNVIPITIRLPFYIGAAVFLLANLWTSLTTKEYPPQATSSEKQTNNVHTKSNIKSIIYGFIKMPKIMREVSCVQFFSWLGMFCIFSFFSSALAQSIYGLPPNADVTSNPIYHKMLEKGDILCGLASAAYTFISIIYAFLIPYISKALTRKGTHILSLTLGAIGLFATHYTTTSSQLLICMIGLGAAWASIVTIPYAILGRRLPSENMGLYMGLLNITICVPQIIAALTLGVVVKHVFANYAMPVIQLAGAFFVIAAILTLLIHDKE